MGTGLAPHDLSTFCYLTPKGGERRRERRRREKEGRDKGGEEGGEEAVAS